MQQDRFRHGDTLHRRGRGACEAIRRVGTQLEGTLSPLQRLALDVRQTRLEQLLLGRIICFYFLRWGLGVAAWVNTVIVP